MRRSRLASEIRGCSAWINRKGSSFSAERSSIRADNIRPGRPGSRPAASETFVHQRRRAEMMRPTLRRYFRHGLFPQLLVFVAVVRLGGVTRAALELHMAQPTV